jgi:hypothetical protein
MTRVTTHSATDLTCISSQCTSELTRNQLASRTRRIEDRAKSRDLKRKRERGRRASKRGVGGKSEQARGARDQPNNQRTHKQATHKEATDKGGREERRRLTTHDRPRQQCDDRRNRRV